MVAGRPDMLNPKLQEAICKRIEKGTYPAKAAVLEGISKDTYYAWMRRGRTEPKGKFYNFLKAIRKAESIAETAYLEQIRKAATGEETGKPVWQAAAWYLERRYPDSWGRRDRVDLNHSGEFKQKVEVDIFAEIKKLETTLKKRNPTQCIDMKKE
jgi:hypothetical protein